MPTSDKMRSGARFVMFFSGVACVLGILGMVTGQHGFDLELAIEYVIGFGLIALVAFLIGKAGSSASGLFEKK